MTKSASLESLLQQLERCPCIKHLQQCSAVVAQAHDSTASVMLQGILARISKGTQAANAAALDHLLQLADTVVATFRPNCTVPTEEQLLLMYSYVKRLASLKRLPEALKHGWQLLADVQAVQASGASSKLDEVFVGASLNVIISTCELDQPVLPALADLNRVVAQLLVLLRPQPYKATVHAHADVLCKSLLKLALRAAEEATQQLDTSAPNSHTIQQVQEDLVSLLTHTYGTTQLSSQPKLLQQVVLKTCEGLPAALRACGVLAVLQAAGLAALDYIAEDRKSAGSMSRCRGRTGRLKSASSGHAESSCISQQLKPLVPAGAAVVCLQAIILRIEAGSCSTCSAVACAEALLQAMQRQQQQQQQHLLQSSLALLLSVLICRVNLPADTLAAVNTALHEAAASHRWPADSMEGPRHAVKHKQQQQQQQQQQQIDGSLNQCAAGLSAQLMACCNVNEVAAGAAAEDIAAVLQLHVWCLEQLLKQPGPGCVRAAVCWPLALNVARSAVAALRCHELQHQCALLAVQAVAAAAALFVHWLPSTHLQIPSSNEASNSHAKSSGIPLPVSASDHGMLPEHQPGLMLQQLGAVVEQLLDWQGLCNNFSRKGGPDADQGQLWRSCCSARDLQWLMQQLHTSAVAASSCGSTSGNSSSSSSMPSTSSNMGTAAVDRQCVSNPAAAGLWLLALQCSCAHAASVQQQQQQQHPAVIEAMCPVDLVTSESSAAGSLEAITTVVKLSKLYVSWAAGRCAADNPGSGSGCKSADSMEPAASGLGCLDRQSPEQHSRYQVVQEVMQVASCLVVLLDANGVQQLAHKWQSVLRSYSRLRCTILAAASQCTLASALPTVGSCSSSSSSSSSSSNPVSSRSSGNHKGRRYASKQAAAPPPPEQEQQQQQRCQEQPSLQGCAVPVAAAHLALGCIDPDTAADSTPAHGRLDFLLWLEGKALAQVLHGAEHSMPMPATKAAAQHLLLSLTAASPSPTSVKAGVPRARWQLVQAMMKLACHDQQPTSSSNSCSLLEVQAALTDACQLLTSALGLDQPNEHVALCKAKADSSSSSSRNGRQTRQRQCSGTSSKKSSSPSSDSSVQHASGLELGTSSASSTAAVVAAVAEKWGHDSGLDLLVSAALAHCLLGLTLAGTAVAAGCSSLAKSSSGSLHHSSNTAAAAAEVCEGISTTEAAVGQDENMAQAPDACGHAALQHQTQVADQLQHSSYVFHLAVALSEQHRGASRAPVTSSSSSSMKGVSRGGSGDNGTCSSNGSNKVILFAEEAAMAAMQAWHVASLQGMCNCLQGFADVLACLAPLLPVQLQEQVAGLQQLMPTSDRGCGSWLSLLVAQQPLPSHLLPACGGHAAATVAGKTTAIMGTCLHSWQQQAGDLINSCLQQQQQQQIFDWKLLQQVQLQLAAANAAAGYGDAATAAILDEAAIQQCRGLSEGAIGAGRLQGSRVAGFPWQLQLCTGEGLLRNSCIIWHALGLYMSGLWQLSLLLDSTGSPEDALRLLKEFYKLSISSGCCIMATLAQASMSCLYSRMGKQEKAAAAVGAAACLLRSTADQCQGTPLCHAYTAASVAHAQAAVYAGQQDYEAAQQQLLKGAGGLATALQLPVQHLQQKQKQQLAPELQMLSWRAVNLWATMQLQLSHCKLHMHDCRTARQILHGAVAVLRATTGHDNCGQCNRTAWPCAEAALLLQLLALSAPPAVMNSNAVSGKIALIGFNSSIHSSDLLAEFTNAAKVQDRSSSTPKDAAMEASRSAKAEGKRSRAGSSRQQGKAGANAGQAKSSNSDSTDTTSTTSSVDAQGPPLQGAAAWLSDLLQLLSVVAQQPFLLKAACGLLSKAFQSYGAVHATAVFLHMSVGVSATQQQLMLAAAKLAQTSRQQMQNAAAAPDQATASQGVWQQVLSQLNVMPLMQQLAQAALQVKTDAGSASLQQMIDSVDVVAQQWLHAACACLPPGMAACTVSMLASSNEPAKSALPCFAVVHPAAAGMAPMGQESSSLVISRMMQGSALGDGGSALPLLVQLPVPYSHGYGDATETGLAAILQELQGILSDAASSMAAAASLSSNSEKAVWWKQRIGLDARMAALVQQLDQQCLGPWRCLLMQPGQPQVEAAAASASLAFVSDFFDCVLEERPKQLLSQLVAVLLIHHGACTPAELQQAMRDLSLLARQRADGLHLERLLGGLAAAYEEVQAAACAAGPPTADRQSSSMNSQDSSSAEPAAEGSAAGMEPVAATSGCSDQAMSSKTSKKATSGRNSRGSRSKIQEHAFRGTQPSDASGTELPVAAAIAATPVTRRVRFVDADAVPSSAAGPQRHARTRPCLHAGPGASCSAAAALHDAETPCHKVVVPVSVARHAVRRTRLRAMGSSSQAHSTPGPPSRNRQGSGIDSAFSVAAADDEVQAQQPALQHSSVAAGSTIDTPADAAGAARRHGGTSNSSSWRHTSAAANVQLEEQCVPSVLLLSDDVLWHLPWESLPSLQQQAMHRCPNLAVAAALATRSRAQAQSAGKSSGVLQLHDSFFLLNPDGDLPATQETFEAMLQGMQLEGHAGSAPNAKQLTAALQRHDLYLYFGHGGGEQYVPLAALKRLDRCAGCLLMGCSSGRLEQVGAYEASGPIWGYLMAGCPAAVANLWDVTDRDIDRFSESVLQCWHSSSSSSESAAACVNTSSSRGSRSCKTHAATADSTQNKQQQLQQQQMADSIPQPDQGGISISHSVAASRQACRLPYLVGAAPVCYGLPALVGAVQEAECAGKK